jgi:hypothetical protein
VKHLTSVPHVAELGSAGPSPIGVFNFSSIGLASATNDRTGGDVVFMFFHTNGMVDSTVVSLQPGTT